ncbi:MAG: hypothetical protein GC168_18505 [Candidatus Hydrogenedens sp.]|nr:hypothetical protein [Candidatus Hydrogenedens sp.]
METLPNFGLANTVTGFATLFSGCLPLALSYLMGKQPGRWMFVYWMILVTGIFTITLHGFGETNPVLGARWFWAFLDTGSNIVVTWAVGLAVLGDYYDAKTRRWAAPLCTLLMIVGVAWHFYDRLPSTERAYLVPLGDWGGFYPGETWLIVFAWSNIALFVAKREQIPKNAVRLLLLTAALFFAGMLLATASNDKIIYPFIPLHALWHLVSAYGFMTLWAFNHVRFHQQPAEMRGMATAG